MPLWPAARDAGVRVVRRRARRARHDARTLFGSRNFIGLTLLTFFLYGALGGLLVLLPYVLITARIIPRRRRRRLLPLPLSSPCIALMEDWRRASARDGRYDRAASGWAGFLLMLRMDSKGDY